MRRRPLLIVLIAAASALVAATQSGADVLWGPPAARTCLGTGKIAVSVWDNGNNNVHTFDFRIFDPRGRIVYRRHGRAPTTQRAWVIRPTQLGTYKTIFYPRTRYTVFPTRVIRCTQKNLRVIGRQSASGDYAIAVASGSVKRPQAIYVRVNASPAQQFSVNWTMVCSRGFGAGSRSGDFVGTSAGLHRLTFPTSSPDDCTVSASAQLDDTGSIVVTLLAT